MTRKQVLILSMGVMGVALIVGVVLFVSHRTDHALSRDTRDRDQASVTATDSEIAVPQPLPTHVSFKDPARDAVVQLLVQDGHIAIGSTIPRTGEQGLGGQALSDGIFVAFNKANTSDGGLFGGTSVSLDQRDDSGDLTRAQPHIFDVLTKTQLFFCPTGDTVFEKLYVPLLQRGKIAVIFPAVGTRHAITKDMPVAWYRPSYAQEVAALVAYAVEVLKQTKIAVFYEDSEWGIEARDAAAHALKKKAGCDLCLSASYQPGTVLIQSAVTAIRRVEPEVIIAIASGRPTYNFIREAINQQLNYVSFLGISRTASIAEQLKISRGIPLITASVVPNPQKSSLPIAKEYRTFMQQYLPNKGLTPDSLEGYIAATLFVYFAQQAGKEAVVKDLFGAVEKVEDMLFKGLVLRYKDQALSHTIWINTGAGQDWLAYEGKVLT